MLALLHRRLSEGGLEAILLGVAEPPPLAAADDPGLLAYLDEMFRRTVRGCRGLVVGDAGGEADQPWKAFVAELTRAYGAELATAAPGGVRETEAIWATPFWLALGLVMATPDGRSGLDFDEVLREARSFGGLLALIDDVVDVEEDWASGSGNQLLEKAGHGAPESRGDREPPWDALLDNAVCGPYMDEITKRAHSLSEQVDRESLAAWLHYWLGP